MADTKISQFPDAALPLDGTELIPIVQSGSNFKITAKSVLSSFQVTGTVSASGNIAATDGFIFATGTITLTLPSAVGLGGKTYYIKNVGTGIITVQPQGGQTIDGNANAVIEFQNTLIGLVSNNANWFIF